MGLKKQSERAGFSSHYSEAELIWANEGKGQAEISVSGLGVVVYEVLYWIQMTENMF